MKRQYLAETILILMLLTLLSCQSTSTLDRIREIEKLEGKDRIEAYQKEAEENPEPELLYNLAYHQLEEGDAESAILTARNALEANPEFLRMRFLLLLSYREAGLENAYLKTLEEIGEELPYDKEIQGMLLDEYKERRDYEKMTSIARWILTFDPQNERALKALSYESDYLFELTDMFDFEKVMETLPEMKTSSHVGEDAKMDWIRDIYVLPFLF